MSSVSDHLRGNVVGYIALFIALGGTAWAANKIDSEQIKRGAVQSKHIDNGQVKSKDIRDGKGVKSKDVKDGTLTGDDVGDGSLGGTDLADGSITGTQVAADGLTGVHVDESTLGQVPDADSVDGLDAAAFLRSSIYEATEDETLNAGFNVGLSPPCDAGDLAISGGWEANTDIAGNLHVRGLYRKDEDEWLISLSNIGGAPVDVQGITYCLDQMP